MIDARQQTDGALRQTHAELRSHAEATTHLNQIAVGRELRMISRLEREVNDLCLRLGEAARYPLDLEPATKPSKAESSTVRPRRAAKPCSTTRPVCVAKPVQSVMS